MKTELIKTDIKEFIQVYKEKLNLIKPIGIGLYSRIISCTSLFRECEDLFFQNVDPNLGLSEIFNKQYKFLDFIDKTILRLSVSKQAVPEPDGYKTQDALHEELFNKTWCTLKISEDPFNDYKPYISLIEKRLMINNLNSDFFSEKKCLDVGCGTGRFGFCMAELGAQVWGIDPGQKSIEQATYLKNLFNMNKKVHFSVGNAYALEFDDDYFDFAVCNGVLHHLDYPEKALQEIYRVLKPNGKFWLYTEGCGGVYHEIWDTIQESFNEIPIEQCMHALQQLGIPNIHFWMDIFFAKYNFISWEDNERRLKKFGFKKIERMKGAEMIDLDMQMFKDDPYAELKFGQGGLRMLITK